MDNAHVSRGASACAIFTYRGLSGRFGPVAEAEGFGAADLSKFAKEFKEAADKVKAYAEKSNTEIKNLGKMTEETKASSDKALADLGSFSTRLTDIEQKMARRPGAGEGASETKSIGHLVIDNPEVKAALASGAPFRGALKVEVKTITSGSVTGTSASTALVPVDRQPGIIAQPNRPLVVRDLLMPGRTSSGFIEFAKELLVTLSAATVAENPSGYKPQSDITYTLTNAPARTIAHWIPASQQIMADAPQLQSQIDGRLRYGLALAEDNQLLNGDGTGTNLSGLNTNAVAYAQPAGVTITNETMIDRLRLAMLQTTLALYPATGIVLNPTDWASIELKKDTQNRYLWGNPSSLLGPTIWGLPVAQSLAQPQNNFLVGALKLAAQIFDREDATVLMSTEDRDNFVKNMVTILAEERLALAIYRPQALIRGNFTGAA